MKSCESPRNNREKGFGSTKLDAQSIVCVKNEKQGKSAGNGVRSEKREHEKNL